MGRKKEIILSVSCVETDTNRENYKPFTNFICKKNDLESSFIDVDKNHIFKENNYRKALDSVLKLQSKTNVYFIDDIECYIDEIVFNSKIKPSDKYFYRLMDYGSNKVVFVSFKDLIPEINKRIKNKYARVWYNGTIEKITYDANEISNIIARMTTDTHEISIAQLKGNGDEDDILLITPYELKIF